MYGKYALETRIGPTWFKGQILYELKIIIDIWSTVGRWCNELDSPADTQPIVDVLSDRSTEQGQGQTNLQWCLL